MCPGVELTREEVHNPDLQTGGTRHQRAAALLGRQTSTESAAAAAQEREERKERAREGDDEDGDEQEEEEEPDDGEGGRRIKEKPRMDIPFDDSSSSTTAGCLLASSQAHSFAGIESRLALLRQMIGSGFQIPQAVLEWTMNRILDAPTAVSVASSELTFTFLCAILPSRPQWFTLTSQHVQIVTQICRFLVETLPLVAECPVADGLRADASTADDRKKRHFFTSMLSKYHLILRLFYLLFAHDLSLTHEFNLVLHQLYQRRQSLTDPAEQALLVEARRRLADVPLRNGQVAPPRLSATAAPKFHCSLRECLQNALDNKTSFATLRDLMRQLSDIFQEDQMSGRSSDGIVRQKCAQWLELLDVNWLDMMLWCDAARL